MNSNVDDKGKGRQMPVHYGSSELNFQTISSPLSTQIPQAAGAAYAFKREHELDKSKKKRCVICYFGDGAASEGDFHAAMGFASTLRCPVLFFVRNNGYAISTPVHEQYRGDGLLPKAYGYCMKAIRVDGNDLLAVHEATAQSREICVNENEPVFIEAMTYRAGDHSTSDDSKRYRDEAEMTFWVEKNHPLHRTRLMMERLGWWNNEMDEKLQQECKDEAIKNMGIAEKKKKPRRSELFTDVYDKVHPELERQASELDDHLREYGQHYKDLSSFEDEK